jgi:hypothetical protein
MEGLGRINLCVGTNNCGKTSVLEAVNILAGRGRPESLFQALARRSERWIDDDMPRTRVEADVRHLFYGHELEANASFRVTATPLAGVSPIRLKKDFPSAFERKRGIVAFTVSGWSDASGHIALWNGSEFRDDHDDFRFLRDYPETPIKEPQTVEMTLWPL